MHIYMQKNINVKNVKEYIKKVNIHIKNYKVTNKTKKKIYLQKCVWKYLKIYICKHENMQIYRKVFRKIFMWKYKEYIKSI